MTAIVPVQEQVPASDAPDTPTYGDPAEPGSLQTDPPQKAARALTTLWASQHWRYERRVCEWEVNDRRRSGESNIWVDTVRGGNGYQVYAPVGRARLNTTLTNKSDRLCHRLTALIYSDPPAPDAEPADGSDEARDAAELATRILQDVQSETYLNDLENHKASHQRQHSYGSGYVHYWIDPRGGGRQPVEVEASPLAQHADDALTDPMTALPWPGDLVKRYVREDGTLTDTVGEAAMRWVPALARDLLHAGQVRFLPWTAEGVSDADCVLIAQYLPRRALVQRYPELAEWAEEQWTAVTGHRPKEAAHLLPLIQGKHQEPKTDDPQDKLVLLTLGYWLECGEYPDGLAMAVVGKDQLVGERTPWTGMSAGTREALDLPVTQNRGFYDPALPHGRGLMDLFGSSSEVRAHIFGVVEDLLDRAAQRKVFVPVTSTYDAKNALLPFMTHIPINAGGEPKYEDVPEVPAVTQTLLDGVDKEMDDASGLQESGQGLQVASVTSGKQANAILGQVQSGLSDLRQNAEAAYVRGCRIQLQLLANFSTVPQIVRWAGEDGRYKAERWVGSDLKGTRQVRLKRGTMTGMGKFQKAELVGSWAAAGWVTPEDAGAFVTGNVAGEIGLQDDPHLMRVRRQIARWEQGPQTEPAPQPQAPALPMLDPMGQPMGQPMPPAPPPNPYAEELARIFDVRPVDQAPLVAMKRVRELGRAMATAKFGRFPPGWQAGLIEAYQAAGVAAQPPQPIPPPQQAASPAPEVQPGAGPPAGVS